MATNQDFARWTREAHETGLAAGREVQPTPMVVYDANLDGSPVAGGQRYYIPQGVCGFAWVAVRPRTTAFARWLKTNGGRSSDYDKAILVWVHEFGQSYECKRAYAAAYASVLRGYGVNAHSNSRLD